MALVVGMMLSFLPIGGGVNITDPVTPGVLAPHAPIRIDSDADFLTVPGVTNNATGNGTVWNPWIIENWEIDGTGSGYGIYIGNTTEYFVVRNCSLYGASGVFLAGIADDSGLILNNVQNGTVFNNTSDFNDQSGISINDSGNCTVMNNTVNFNDQGIFLNRGFNNTIRNNVADSNALRGITVWQSANNLIYQNHFTNSPNPPISSAGGDNFWDNGYPGGGNYYSHYVGVDFYSGPGQNLTGSDGIGDSNFTFSDDVDNYPLMMPGDYPFALNFTPAHNATDVSVNVNITIYWNETMDWLSVEGAFSITNGTGVWNSTNGTWSHNSQTNISNFQPGFDIAYNTTYTVAVNVSATDEYGKALDQDKNGTGGYWPADVLTWSFTTEEPPETVPPFALNWTPASGAANVSIFTAINVTWNETMNWDSVNASFSYTNGTTVWTGANGTWQFNDTFNTSIFTPLDALAFEETYTVTFNKTAVDMAGNSLNQSQGIDGNLTWNFTTIDACPYVIYAEPRNVFPLDDSVNPEAPFVITFSEPMNRTAVEASLYYTNGTGGFNGTSGTWNWSDGSDVAIFLPDRALDNATTYSVTLDGGMARDLDGRLLDGDNDSFGGDNYSWSFTTWTNPPPPTIRYVIPAHDSTLVNVNTNIVIAFNISGYGNTMDEDSVENAFSVTGSVSGSVWDRDDGVFSWTDNSKIMTYTPDNFFDYEDNYTLRLRGTARSTFGIGIDSNENGVPEGSVADDMVTNFRTSPRPPMVIDTLPPDGEDGVPVTLDYINITFDKNMDNTSVTEALTISPAVASTITWHENNTKMAIGLNMNLTYEKNYTVTLDADIATDAGGIWLDGNGDGAYGDDYVFRFSTIEAPDTTGPNITEVIPPDGAIDISINVKLGVMFSEPMNETSVEEAFMMTNSTGAEVNGTFVWNMDSSLMQFVPKTNLTANTTYTVSISGTARDAAENPMIHTYTWSFTTAGETGGDGFNMIWGAVAIIMFLLIIIMHQRVRLKHLDKQHRKAKVKIKQMRREMVAAGIMEPANPETMPGDEDVPDEGDAGEKASEDGGEKEPTEEEDGDLDDFSSGYE